MMDKDLTPARRQYLAFKKKHPNAILFFRMGDFYETFDDDARVVSKELEIVLTGREMGKAGRVPLAGIPHHAAENYIARLINKGYKVAICEQIGPVPATGIVERDIVRVVTPGTVVEPGLLSERRNNYLAAVVVDGSRAGLAYADVSTGEFAATEIDGSDVMLSLGQELARLQPAECLVTETSDGQADSPPIPALPSLSTHFTAYAVWHFSADVAQRALLEHFQVATLDGYGLRSLPLAMRAAGALLQYVQETQQSALAQLTQLATYSISSFMVLDAINKAGESVAARIQLIETRQKEVTERVSAIPPRIDALVSGADALAARIQLVEAHDQAHLDRETDVKLQLTRIETAQAGILEEAKRGMSRAESLIPDIEQLRKDIIAVHEDIEKKNKESIASLGEQKEAIAAVRRRAEEAIGNTEMIKTELERLGENTFLIAEAANRLTLIEEHTAVIEAAHKGYQESQDSRWASTIPDLQNTIEEANNSIQTANAVVQELIASNQMLKEDIRALQVGLVAERTYSEDLAAALRGLIEEDVQTRLVMAQKQLQNVRRLANAPAETTTVESSSTNE